MRRSLPLYWIIFVLLAGLVVFFQLLSTGEGRSPDAVNPLLEPIVYEDPQRLTKVTVDSVVDGDTIRVFLPQRNEPSTIRYYGIDTPERGDPCYEEAKERNEELVGKTVLLLEDDRDKDSSDRLLRYVFREDGISIDFLMIAEGYARAWREDGAYRDRLVQAESVVQGRRIGCLWRGLRN